MGIILIAALAVAVAAVLFVQPRGAVRLLARLNPDVLFFVETSHRAVALTIDDGPSAEVTPGILDRLSRAGARATFFVTGERVAGHEDLLARIREQGSELANHLMRDRPSILLSPAVFDRRLAAVDELLGPREGSRWFRPASGWFTRRMLRDAAARGYRCCLASIYPHDNKLRRPRWIADFILRRVRPGAVIVLHDGGPHRRYTLDVLDIILPALQRRGYEVRTVSDLVNGANPGHAGE